MQLSKCLKEEVVGVREDSSWSELRLLSVLLLFVGSWLDFSANASIQWMGLPISSTITTTSSKTFLLSWGRWRKCGCSNDYQGKFYKLLLLLRWYYAIIIKYLRKEYYRFFCSNSPILRRSMLRDQDLAILDPWSVVPCFWRHCYSSAFSIFSPIGASPESLWWCHHRRSPILALLDLWILPSRLQIQVFWWLDRGLLIPTLWLLWRCRCRWDCNCPLQVHSYSILQIFFIFLIWRQRSPIFRHLLSWDCKIQVQAFIPILGLLIEPMLSRTVLYIHAESYR